MKGRLKIVEEQLSIRKYQNYFFVFLLSTRQFLCMRTGVVAPPTESISSGNAGLGIAANNGSSPGGTQVIRPVPQISNATYPKLHFASWTLGIVLAMICASPIR
jgi:hypothetical protein